MTPFPSKFMAAPALVARQSGQTGVSPHSFSCAIVFVRKGDRYFLEVFIMVVTVPNSVSTVLADVYGAEFERASQKERLLFIEAIAFCLRVDCEFNEGLALIFGTYPNLPMSIYTPAKIQRNEGLKLLAVLQVAIVEGYAALAFTK
ncbi:hypothetical protein [Microcoleus sp. Pol10D4]|uniref:hypothetical protein n=1 Tax=Microcoleus sp. Pol10D4 TaxID=3055387 RepID=UPI002FD2E7C6